MITIIKADGNKEFEFLKKVEERNRTTNDNVTSVVREIIETVRTGGDKAVKDYTVRYYYGDNTSSELYAEFSYEGKGDDPKSVLTLYESRDGFDPGVYSVMWFMSEQYVTYWPLNSSADGEGFEKYLANEVPLMFKFVNSYSWDGAMQTSGAEDGGAKGYACLGLKLFVWDHTEKEIMRNNFVWGVGGNPLEYYSYIPGSQGEYKKAVLKRIFQSLIHLCYQKITVC